MQVQRSGNAKGGGARRRLSVAQMRVVQWLENNGVVFVRMDANEQELLGRKRRKALMEEDVVASLCDGVELCCLVHQLQVLAISMQIDPDTRVRAHRHSHR